MEHAFYQIDVRHLASKVKAPTLVLHARQDACIPLEEGRLLASMIPGSRFVQLESRNHVLIEQEPAWGRFRAAGRQSQDGPQLHEPHLYETGSTKSRASHRPGPRSGFREVDRPILVENTSDTYRNWDTSPFFHPQVAAKLVTGELLQPGDARYDEARQLYNGMVDKRPGLIARCVDLADVQASVNFARQKNLLLAVRGGGHNGAGLGSCDDGLVIDLSLMKGVHVDLATGTVRVEGGCTWGDVDHATHPFGLAVPTGFISTAGVGGLTLGGGLGYLTRRYGLAIDNLLEVEMVLADGRIITASADQNEDLFWAVRGGGGNFGVVTSFLFRGCPVSTVYGGPMFWEMEHAATIMRYWRDLILKGQQEINGWFGFHTVPPVEMFPAEHHLKKMAVITWCYTGELAEAERVFEPIRHLAPRAIDFAQVIVGVDPDPANNERMIQWSKTYWEELHPYSAGGAYVNMIMEKGQDRIEAAYRDNYPRLAQIKARYDPDNLFRVNQNIRPATGS